MARFAYVGLLVWVGCTKQPEPEHPTWDAKPDKVVSGVEIARRDEQQIRPKQQVLQQVDPNEFRINDGQTDGPDPLAAYAEDLYRAGVKLQTTQPDEAKRLLDLAAHAGASDPVLLQKVDARMAELGTTRSTDTDPIPPAVRRAGSEAVLAYLDVLVEGSMERGLEARDRDRRLAASHFRRVMALTAPADPLHQKAASELSKLGVSR